MSRLDLFLVLVLVASSLALVTSRYHERRLYALLDQAERMQLKLETDRERLNIERTQLSRDARITDKASHELKMVAIRPLVDTEYFPLAGAAAVGPSVSPASEIPQANKPAASAKPASAAAKPAATGKPAAADASRSKADRNTGGRP